MDQLCRNDGTKLVVAVTHLRTILDDDGHSFKSAVILACLNRPDYDQLLVRSECVSDSFHYSFHTTSWGGVDQRPLRLHLNLVDKLPRADIKHLREVSHSYALVDARRLV